MIKVQVLIDDAMLHEEEFSAELTEFYIGRRPHHAVHLDDQGVSRDHARVSISNSNNAIVLEDLKSSNGTLLNGSLITHPVALNPNDTIQIAKFKLRIQDHRNLQPSNAEPTTWLANTRLNGDDQTSDFDKTGFYSYKEYQKYVEENS